MLPLAKTKKIFYTTLTILLSITGAFFVVIFLISGINKKLSILDNELKVETEKENIIQNLERIIIDTEEEREILDSYSIDPDGVVLFINDIENYAYKSKVEPDIVSVDITEQTPKHPVFEIFKIDLRVEGDWSGVKNFIDIMDALPYSKSIKTMRIDKKSDNVASTTELWDAEIVIEVLKKK
ncbi:hypothetical protein COW81_02825 [Candidatus Campbellbacteria bacterium CG22_combo_CG10-13_8_21_14_all_36_13]|uniref:Uncharacterized protein n=1 Tax=Candidatus Campbellbacteria bacterium CG22_combo_CG10-13_8_21_14_all_36_13 TaxID=1974529 RepID=A0A2H0DZD9_9BACT|nr:MAG: hypothetical protein COW81_02825 [Candidatus Campbellbacteria bacterium CG22_combo_CG10-13_8_21_14_all_36_13]